MVIRELIIPDKDTYTLHIPKEYLHKEIEIILLPSLSVIQKEVCAKAGKEFEPAIYHGASTATKQEIDNYLQKSRDDWQS